MGIGYRNSEGYTDPTAFAAIANIDKQEKTERRLQYRPLVYVCSPFAGDINANIKAARCYSRYVALKGCLPITPHLLFPQFLSEQSERRIGLEMGIILLGKCSQLWVFGDDISSGMREEIAVAERKGIPVRYFTADLEEQDGNCIR